MTGRNRIAFLTARREDWSAAAEALTQRGWDVHWIQPVSLAVQDRFDPPCACLIVDWDGCGHDMHALLNGATGSAGAPVIALSTDANPETAIEAARRGVFDFLIGAPGVAELPDAVSRAVLAVGAAGERRSVPSVSEPLPMLVGTSAAMRRIYREIGRVAPTNVSVVILGETGTGKELVARALWRHGSRRQRPFVAVNCAAIPAALLESELFGHERGAFTGADVRRIGRFEQADGGTLLLDEIGDLSLEVQAKLLRVLQERVVTRLGSRELIPVDVRVIAATHRDLPAMVREGAFRRDLWYRLNVVSLALPPLRERCDDIPELVAAFVRRHGPDLGGAVDVTPGAYRLLEAQPWPGNVRELENTVKRMLVAARGYAITEEICRAALTAGMPLSEQPASALAVAGLCAQALQRAQRGVGAGAVAEAVHAIEGELLMQAYAATAGNITRMAQLLGWSRLTVRDRLRLHHMRFAAEQVSVARAPAASLVD